MQPTALLPVVVDTTYDAEYLAAQPAAVQAMMKMPLANQSDTAERQVTASQLAAEGYVIEGTIMVYGWSASYTTAYLLNQGYTWVPAFNQPPVSLAPGESQGSTPPYVPTIVPPGAIVLTMNTALLKGIYTQRKVGS